MFGQGRTIDLTIFGKKHLKKCDLQEISYLEDAKKKMLWGTYGKTGKRKLKWVKLHKCDDEHLINILRQPHIVNATREIILSILSGRVRKQMEKEQSV